MSWQKRLKDIEKKLTKKEQKAYMEFMRFAPQGEGSVTVREYALGYIVQNKGKDCAPLDILESWKSDVEYVMSDVEDIIEELENPPTDEEEDD